MDRALWKLLFLRLRGGLRQRLHSLRSLRGIVLSIVAISFVGFWLAPAVAEGGAGELAAVKTATENMMPVMLLGVCLVTLATTRGPAIYFNSAEVNFLFAGPFSRRSLLLYKFALYATGATISALCVSLFVPHYTGGWPAAFAGAFLTLVFVQLFSAALGLLGQTVAALTFRLLRWGAIAAVGLALATACWLGLAEGSTSDLFSVLGELRSSTVGQVLLGPFRVFSETLMADNLRDLLRWGSLAAGVDLGLLAAVLWLDAEYFEVVEAKSRRLHQRWQQIRRGQLLVDSKVATAVRLPRFSRCGGAGLIAWRQLTTALRTSGRSLLLILTASVVGGPLLAAAVADGFAPFSLIGAIAMASIVILPRTFTFDFRGDVDHFDWLKSLPLRPTAVVLGELVSPTLLASAVHLLLISGAVLVVTPADRPLLIAVAPLVLPMNLLHYGLENVVFLLFPSRVMPVGRVDFEFFGRMLLEIGFKVFVLTICAVMAAILATIVYLAAGRSIVAASAVAGMFLLAAAIPTVLAAAWAFRRFDVSDSVPD